MSEEKKEELADPNNMKPEESHIGFDEKGFWHFIVHESVGMRGAVRFLEQAKWVAEDHYIKKAIENQQKGKGIIPVKPRFSERWH